MREEINYILTAEQAKEVDSQSIQMYGIPSLVLMERAALALSEEICKNKNITKQARILVVAGMGNNGADGLAAARILHEFGYQNISVLAIGKAEKATQEWKCQCHILDELEISVIIRNQLEEREYIDIRESDLIIDALFGIGLKRDISGVYEKVIESINESCAEKYSIDIPSGICASTGKIMGCAVKADRTVTFGYKKLGMVLYPGAEYAGFVICREIGFPKKIMENVTPKFFTYTQEAIRLLPKRPAYSNKGTFGKILVIAGSPNMAGAAFLSASAAYAAGSGLVRIFTHEKNRTILQTLIPEAILTTYETEKIEEKRFNEVLRWADTVVIGPGLSVSDTAEQMVEYVWKFCTVPMVVDADALNIMAKHLDWWMQRKAPAVITPHLGELARLMGKTVESIKANLIEEVCLFQRKVGVVLVAKDTRTIVAENGEMIYINTSGNSGMAKAGSGDVLTGIIAAFLARKMCPFQAASMGVYLHGLAGDEAKQCHGEYGMKATDLPKGLAELLHRHFME